MPALRSDSPTQSIARKLALIALAVMSLVVFAGRALLHSPRLYDFRTVYAASRAWRSGENPYDHPTLERLWKDAGGKGLVGGGAIENFPSVYPPTTFAVLSPLSFLPAEAACAVWVAILLGLLAGMIYELGRLAELSPTQHVLLAAIVLLLGPLHSGMQGGNVVVPAVACIVIGLAQIRRGRITLAMALLVIAACLKPQLGLPFMVWQLLRYPKPALAAVLACMIVFLASLVPLRLSQAWLSTLQANYEIATAPSGSFDFTFHNRIRDHLINAQVPIFSITQNVALTQAIVGAITVALIAAVLVRWRQVRTSIGNAGIDQLLGVSIVATIALMPVYHRYYDALQICLPIAWAIRRGRLEVVVLLLLALPFLMPVGWVSSLESKGYAPRDIAAGLVWSRLLTPLYGWLILTWCFVLVGMWWRRGTLSPSPGMSGKGLG